MREVKEQLSLITFLLLSSFYGGQPPNPQASLRSKVDEKGRKENIIVKIGERVLGGDILGPDHWAFVPMERVVTHDIRCEVALAYLNRTYHHHHHAFPSPS
jgi:hypothetical protein